MNVQHLASPDTLKMTSGWWVARADGAHDVAMNVPGDVHSSLLRAGVVPAPSSRVPAVSVARRHDADLAVTRLATFARRLTKAHTLRFACCE